SHLEAQEAVKVFLSGGAEGEEDVVTILRQESAKQRKRKQTARIVAVSFISSYIIIVLAFLIMRRDISDLSSMGGMMGVMGATAALTGRHKMAARAAAKLKDKRAIGSLLEILSSEDKELRALAEEAVAEMLPNLQAADYAQLDQVQIEALGKALYR